MQQVPQQKKGSKSDFSHSVTAQNGDDGSQLYEKAKQNLLDINNWHVISGKLSARFFLTDPFGKEVQRLPLQGDYIKIHLPSSSDDKFDWVRIESIEERKIADDASTISMRVRPSDPPKKQEETEHFFSKEATSSFVVERKGNKVNASVHGRNELPNTSEPEGVFKKVRNAAIAIAAIAGFNMPQWKGLAKGIVTSSGNKHAIGFAERP
jgi:hypothetical protein